MCVCKLALVHNTEIRKQLATINSPLHHGDQTQVVRTGVRTIIC